MGHFTGRPLVLHIAIAFLGAMLLLTDGGNITWFDPPPFETVTDASSISRTNKSMSQGSTNEELSCNFSLTPDLNITTVTMKFRGYPAVTFVPNVLPHVELAFTERFNAVWVPNKLTLIMFNVTSAEEGEYCCEVVTIGTSARTWIRKIQLLVVDERQTRVSTLTASEVVQRQTTVSFTATEDPIQTTVSFTATEDQIQTTASTIRPSEVDIPWGFIVVGVVLLIAIVCFWKWGKCFKRNDSGGTEPLQMVVAQNAGAGNRPLARDRLNADVVTGRSTQKEDTTSD